ncbi:oligosaccharide flippase family protein [candidate division KSB1 bacterium]|nr:oligosaccharide flippase family protein [candidate division KSB1 bacterium]
MTWAKKLASHTSQYFLAEVLVTASGVISFPIFTRVLTKWDYGIMNIVTATLTMFGLFAGAGFRPPLYRFYSEFKNKNKSDAIRLLSTMFWSTCISATVGIVLLVSARLFLPKSILSAEIGSLLALASILLLIRSCIELIFVFLRIEERTVLYAASYVAWKYLGLLLSITFVMYLDMRLKGLYLGLILGEGLVFLFLLVVIFRQFGRRLLNFSKTIFSESIRYGLPLMGQNFAGFINSLGDRYVIQFLKGPVAVAVYSVGYNLAEYVQALFVNTLNTALIPLTMNIWANKGEGETRQFLTKYCSLYVFIVFPVIFGLTAISHQAVEVIATSKFQESADLIVYIIIGVMFAGAHFPATAGLHLYKKTMVIAKLMFFTAAFNIALNFIFVPIWGIKGAAIATLLSCSVQIFLSFWLSSRYLKIKFETGYYLLYFLAAVIMYGVIWLFPTAVDHKLSNLLLKIISGALTYLTAVMLLDKRLRHYAGIGWQIIRKKVLHSAAVPK